MPAWVRVRDPQTGAEFDRRPTDHNVISGRFEVLEDYPENRGRHPRPTKSRVDKAGNPATPEPKPAASPPKETDPAVTSANPKRSTPNG